MQKYDIEKRNFIKSILLAVVMAFVIEFGVLNKLVFGQDTNDIALLYSTATGIVLRTINPGTGEQSHLDWLAKNLPDGTALLRLDKKSVGADDNTCPNLDKLIPYVQQNNGITLNYGKPCIEVDTQGKVVGNFTACPVLYQDALNAKSLTPNTIVADKAAEIGDSYDAATGTVTPLNPIKPKPTIKNP